MEPITRRPPRAAQRGFSFDGAMVVFQPMKTFAMEIYRAVRSGKLKEPFNADMVRKACPGWADQTYNAFLPKHEVDNTGGNSGLFKRTSPGFYKTLSALHKTV
jgi:hypothetical protein